MLAKIPVVATDVGAVREFVNSDIATLIPPESPVDISEVLESYLRDRGSFLSKIDKANKHIQKFSGENMSRQYYRILHLA
jgi:glycosyltransferase involved in cell wall biosynthesis